METQENRFADLRQYTENYKPEIENALRENLPSAPAHIETEFIEALEYALSTDKIRICPVLTLLGAELVGGNSAEILPAAAAVEYIRTSSQIFADLLDAKVIRNQREKKSLDEKYGKDFAVLNGLGFLNAAFPLVFVNHSGMPELALAAHAEITECVSAAGLIGGLDVKSFKNTEKIENEKSSSELFKNLRQSALIRLSLRVGAILSGANYIELGNLSRFAGLFSEAYQLNGNSEQIDNASKIKSDSAVEEAKLILIENFSSNEARSCLIQLTDYLALGEIQK